MHTFDSTPGCLQSFDFCRKHASLTETRPSFSDEPVTLWYPNEEREGHPKRLCCHRGYVLEDHSTECFYTYMLEDPMSCHLRVCHELQDIPGSWNMTDWSRFIQWSSSMYHPLQVLYESTRKLPIDSLEQFEWSIFHQRFQIQKALYQGNPQHVVFLPDAHTSQSHKEYEFSRVFGPDDDNRRLFADLQVQGAVLPFGMMKVGKEILFLGGLVSPIKW